MQCNMSPITSRDMRYLDHFFAQGVFYTCYCHKWLILHIILSAPHHFHVNFISPHFQTRTPLLLFDVKSFQIFLAVGVFCSQGHLFSGPLVPGNFVPGKGHPRVLTSLLAAFSNEIADHSYAWLCPWPLSNNARHEGSVSNVAVK
jgi:hypothetical protein